MEEIILDTIEDAIAAIQAGMVIIVVDDEDRENEGDMICAAECITPAIVNLMAKEARGLICVSITEARCNEIPLPMMVEKNTSLHETAFTISVDLKGFGCTTGISSHDRAKTIKALADPEMKLHNFGTPGHVFPLKAKNGGVMERIGHTEAAIDFARISGFRPCGVLIEVLSEDGTMARLPELREIANRLGIKLVSIKDLVEYRGKE